MMRLLRLLLLLAVLGLGVPEVSAQPYTTGPIKTFDPDNQPIPQPEERYGNQYWDPIDRSVFYQLEKPLNLNWTLEQAGGALGVVTPREADNVNTLDEVPNSSWFTQRHFYFPMTIEALQRGPIRGPGPDTEGAWTVVAAKNEGRTKGFTIEDARGDRYIIKFDGPDYPELTTSAEAIATRIFYAAGYHVPENSVVYFDPNRIEVGSEAEVEVAGRKRPMTERDLAAILDALPRRNDGTIRALASKFVDGIPVGPWGFRGTRSDDPNDRVRHEHRRELRGLSVIGSWLNDTDRRDANTMAVYHVPDGAEQGYIVHYLLDMGSTLGANADDIHAPRHGQEYMFDLRMIFAQALSLGTYVKPWEFEPKAAVHPSVGYFEAELFDPGAWVMVHPNPAYENRTLRDAFWGAKRVMAFTEEAIRAIVATGQLSDPEAEEYLVQTLLRRQEKIGRYWFAQINPLDRFEVVPADEDDTLLVRGTNGHAALSPSGEYAALRLRFDDLAVTSGLEAGAATRYRWAVYHRGERLSEGIADAPEVALPPLPPAALASEDDHDRVLRVALVTLRDGQAPSKRTDVYVHLPRDGRPRLAGIERET